MHTHSGKPSAQQVAAYADAISACMAQRDNMTRVK
jgi:hypothetical protein